MCGLLGLGDLVANLDELLTDRQRLALEWWRAAEDLGPPEDEASTSQTMLPPAPNVSRETFVEELLSRAAGWFIR